MTAAPIPTDRLGRQPESAVTAREDLDAFLDSQWAGVLSTVAQDEPVAVPMLYARVADRVLLHGSTGAGVLRHVAAGAPAVLTVFAVDALVVAPTTFESSVNYRSATVRARLQPLAGELADAALELFSERIIPGRTAEVRASTAKELAATLAMWLPIEEGGWLMKADGAWPATPAEAGAEADVWSGRVPVSSVLGAAVPAPWAEDLPVPESVLRLTEADRH